MSALKLARLPMAALALVALVALPSALAGNPLALSLRRVDLGPLGSADIGVRLGIVELLLLTLVAGIGTVVSTYSARNLVGQRRLGRYAALEMLTVGALALAVTASSLPLLAAGWTTATLGLSALVAHADTPTAADASRQVRARLLVGDVLLWAGVVAVGAGVGTLDRGDLAARVDVAPVPAVTLAALLVVGAGMVRSALLPANRWLPETAEAPSPVSALLHAGLVNGVGVLALLLWPLVVGSPAARVMLLGVGAATAAVATAQMRTRADVKGRLAASTSSQMGYLAVQAALGIPAAVLAHVIGHGVWKASLFLGAGGTVERSRRRGAPAGARRTPLLLAVAGVASAATVATAALAPVLPWPALTAPAELLPLAMATSVGWLALLPVFRHRGSRAAHTLAAVVVLALTAGYVVGLRALGHTLADVVGQPAPWGTTQGWLAFAAVLMLVVVGVGVALVDGAAGSGRLPSLARRAARASLQPWTLRERLTRRPSVAIAIPPVTHEDADAARRSVGIAARTGGVLYPLTSFVASNPLAGLEALPVEDATRIAVDVWGAEPGPSARFLREALADDRADDADVDAVLDAAFGPDSGASDAGGTPDRRSLAGVLLLADHPGSDAVGRATRVLADAGVAPEWVVRTPLQVLTGSSGSDRSAALIDRRARNLAHHCSARSLAGPTWPGASGPWQELRASAPALDAMLRVRGAGELVGALPAEASAATAALLEHLGVRQYDRPTLLARLLARDPGWPAHLAWRTRHARLGAQAGIEAPPATTAPEQLVDELVATRLAIEVVVAEAHAPRVLGRPFDPADLTVASHDRVATVLAAAISTGLVTAKLSHDEVHRLARALAPLASGRLGLLRAEVLERAFRRRLLGAVGGRRGPGLHTPASEPAAQLVTCIDVRSERLRRHVEQLGAWETLGAAGFFGLPLRHAGVNGRVTERAPALLRPTATLTERPLAARGVSGSDDDLLSAVGSIEAAPALPFGWAELAGWVQAPFLLLATLTPRFGRALRDACRRALGAPRHGVMDVVGDVGAEPLVEAAAGFLGTLGIRRLAPIVVIVGHGGRVANNPHVAAYDCGACGGAAGDVSARAMAQALNDPAVRAGLRQRGVSVPEDTLFVAVLHDTTRDVVEVLDRHAVPERLHGALDRLEQDLSHAGARVRKERLDLLPDARHGTAQRLRRHVEDRAADWAQPRPEWGLAGAAAIVVGPRELSVGRGLEGRVFLQSYRPDLDPEGEVLEQLLAAPVVVAQWITAQYWASTVDPHRFGAGDKTTHNVVGDGVGLSAVLTGARGDLRLGLPWQAVSATAPETRPDGAGDPWRAATRHEPVRLLTVVYAEAATVERLLARQPSVARLVTGGWMTLSVVEPEDGRALTRSRDGAWVGADGRPADGWDRESVHDAS